MMTYLSIAGTSFANCQPANNPVVQARALLRQAGNAYNTKQYQAAADLYSQAHHLRPDHPGIIYNLAACDALLGKASEALRGLEQIAAMGLVYHPEKDSDFVSMWKTSDFQTVLSRFQDNGNPVGNLQTAVQLKETALIAEGLAHNEQRKEFYIGSVRKRKIICIDQTGVQGDLSVPSDSLWCVMGMAVDQKRQVLWAATSALPQMEGFREDLRGRASIVQYDLQSRKMAGRWDVSPDGAGHIIGDLTLAKDGVVYATDSQSPNIYRINGSGMIELFLTSKEFVNLQGIAFSADGKTLYVSDYSRGVIIIDPITKRVERLNSLDHETLLSLDGLYYYGHSLIATQNDISPSRVVRLFLDNEGKSITRLKVLEANTPSAEEPSLGVVVNDEFYFNGNSQWSKVGDQGQLDSKTIWEPHVVLKLLLQ